MADTADIVVVGGAGIGGGVEVRGRFGAGIEIYRNSQVSRGR